MTVLEFVLDTSIPPDIADEIAKKACYCSERITSSRFLKSEGLLRVEINDESQADATRELIENLIARMKSGRVGIIPERLHSRIASEAQTKSTYSGLSREGLGTLARDGEFLQLLRRFDSLFCRIAIQYFSATEQEYNALIPTDWLRRAGYLSSFPHSLTFAMHLRENHEAIERFAGRHRNGEQLTFAGIEELADSEYCLSPAVCFHTYGLLSTKPELKIETGLIAFTAQNRCFRYESKNIVGVERLWEFTMREIVLVGEKDRILEARSRGIELIWRLVEILDLTCWLETAVDPFFTSDFQSKRFFQLANQLKYELRLPLRDEESLAVGSFNYHENFFGDRFGILTLDGSQAHTGCIAIGLERFVHAVLMQLGAEVTIARLNQAEQYFLRSD